MGMPLVIDRLVNGRMTAASSWDTFAILMQFGVIPHLPDRTLHRVAHPFG
jgi:hypothetical protein